MTRNPAVRLAPFVVLALVSALCLAAPRARAGEGKIGIVHIRYVLVHSKAGLAAAKSFAAYRASAEKRFRVQKARLAQEQKMLRARLPKENRAARERDIQAFRTGVETLRKEFVKIRAELYAEHNKLFQPVEKALLGVIHRFAKRHGYGLVIDGSQAGVVIAKGGYDLTPKILAAMNAAPLPKKG